MNSISHQHLTSWRNILAAASLLCGATLQAQSTADYELPPIEYSKTEPNNHITTIQQHLNSGQLTVGAKTDKELLGSLLKALKIPVESQVLVFSRTSLQRKRIQPERPRALYFSDDCYIGWVPGGLIEAAVSDAKLGLVFYQVDPEESRAKPRFTRENDCLSCHGGSMTRNWPGLMVRSVFPNSRGEPILPAGTFLTDHDSSLAERWGGWYVTGKHGAARHMGNAIADDQAGQTTIDREPGANLTDLSRFFETKKYLRSDSDIVALMVLEHQINMHNRLCKAGLNTRKWLDYQKKLQKELGQPATEEPTGTALIVLRSEAQAIVEHLLYYGEIELPDGGVQGDPGFQKAFIHNRHADSQGRSLKDFDLQKHLFKHRCSYMIYSQAFENLPQELKAVVYRQLFEILSTPNPPEKFAHLSVSERLAIREILHSTKPDLAAMWNSLSRG